MAVTVAPKIVGSVGYDPTAVAITGGTLDLTSSGSGFASGSAASPGIPFSGDNDGSGTGLYQTAANRVTVSINGTGQFEYLSNIFRMVGGATLAWTSGVITAGSDTTLTRQSAGLLAVNGGTATPAGGSSSLGLVFGATAGFGIYIGSGVPTLSAAQGSIYLRSDGSSTSTRLYVNTNGTTGWTNVTTAT